MEVIWVHALPGEEVGRQVVIAVAGLVTGGAAQRTVQHPRDASEDLDKEPGT